MKIRRAELLTSCAGPSHFPEPGAPEFAFLGRSNVGKSSLLNALVQRKKLARTSATPGKTRLIHFFDIELEGLDVRFVDLPGYGWARVSKKERESWQPMVESYLDGRAPLRTAILLQDIRRDVTEDETLLLRWLAEREIDALVVLTKADKLKTMKRKQAVKTHKAVLEPYGYPVLVTSSLKGVGLPELWSAIRERAIGPPAESAE